MRTLGLLLATSTIAYASPGGDGLTLEASFGMHYTYARAGGAGANELGPAGPGIGVGQWLNDRLVVGGRVAFSYYFDKEPDVTTMTGFVGPYAQYWPTDSLWVSGGAGLGFAGVFPADVDMDEGGAGAALDLRAGVQLLKSRDDVHTLNLSIEAMPGFARVAGETLSFASVALVLGYQAL